MLRVRILAAAVLLTLAIGHTAAASELDPRFGRDGVSLSPRLSAAGAGTFAGIVRQPDGSIVAAGTAVSLRIARWSPAGRFRGVRTLTHPSARQIIAAALARRSDGMLLVAGDLPRPDGGSRAVVAALTPAGDVVSGYGRGGLARDLPVAGGTFDFASALVPLAGGAAVVGGEARRGERRHLALARLDRDGRPDPSFGDRGVVTLDPGDGGPVDSTVEDLAVQPDGKLVMAATAVDVSSGTGRIVVARWDPDGRPDPSFGGGRGHVRVDFPGLGPDQRAAGILVTGPAGTPRLVLAAAPRQTTPAIGLVALRSDGSLDGAFGRGGLAGPSHPGTYPEDLLWLGRGRLAVAGSNGNPALAKYLADGSPDRGWGSGGIACTEVPARRRIFEGFGSARILPGGRGRVLLGGAMLEGTDDEAWLVARYRASHRDPIDCWDLVELDRHAATFQVALGRRSPVVLDVFRRRGGARVGRVAMGARPAGAQRVRWNYRVRGRRVRAGRYLVVPRLMDRGGRVLASERPETVDVPGAPRAH